MKVLFAVNDEKDAESITRMYQKEFKEIITSKTVYYYNAIIKELQKDKSYDRIVISEDLEMFSSNNYQAVDKFVFEKMDAISDEATNNEGGDIPIILLAMDRRTKNDPLLVKLFGLGIYNVLLGKDRSVQKVAELINKPRSKKEAKAYYRVETEKVSYSSDEDNNGVSESEMQSILNHYKRIGGNIPKCVRSFDSIISQYSEEQAKLIAKSLPKSVTEILEDNSDSYRKLLGIEGQRFPGIGAKKDNDYVEKEIETSSKLKQPVIIPTAVSSKKINRVRSAEEIRRAKLRLEKEKAQEEAQKREEERIEREKAEMARKKREQLLKERAEAEAKRKAEVEAKRKEREKILRERAKAEARRKEEERIAREKAEEEARRKEEERIAREKAEEEERRKEEERIAREKAEEEARRKEEERIAREKAKAEARRKEEERIAKEKAREEARRKEEESIAREKAEEEEKRKEEEKMARKKAEAEAKKKEERKIKAKTVATKSTKEENNDDEIVTTKRRRGRPRKNPVIEEIDENNELEDVPVKRRRGRPRKNPIIVENEKEDEVVSNRKNTTTKESDNKQNKHNDDIDKDNDLDEFDNLNYNDDEINDDKYYNDKYDDESDNYDDDFDYDDYDFDDLDDDYKSEDLEEDYNDDKDSKLSEFDDYDDKDLDDTSDYEDEDKEDDDTLPGFEDYDDEDSEDSKDTLDYEDEDEENDDTLPGFEDYDDEDSEDTLDYEDEDSKDSKDTLDYEDEDEEDDDTLPGFEDYDDEESEDSKDTLDYEDEDEEDDDTLPGFDDYDDEDSENDSKDTLDYEDEDEEDDDTLPGFDDYDDEDSEDDSKDTLDYEDEDEEDDDPLPGFDEDEDDNDFKDTENDYKEENDDDIDDMFDYDDEEDNKEEEKEENQTQHNGTFKGINNRNYRYDNNLADSIKDLKETEETQEYNVDTDNLITSNQKIISFVGTSKNGTSFIVNNLAELFSNRGINTAILDLTKNKNSYYVYTNNENELKEKAQTCLDKLKQGIADGVQVNKNLTVYTSLPNEDDSLDEVTAIIHTLLENYSIVLLDCDFDTDVRYFKVAQEIYLVQSLDVLTIQPLTAFLRDLKVKNILDTSKLRIIINKNIKMKLLDERNLIAGMSSYNDPAMTYMTELFDENTIKFITIPFEDQVYVKYLESLVNCNINLKGYSKNFMSSLNKLADMVYPTINGKKAKENYNNFSKNTNSILDKMKKKY